jgi:anti-anti-sigma factor
MLLSLTILPWSAFAGNVTKKIAMPDNAAASTWKGSKSVEIFDLKKGDTKIVVLKGKLDALTAPVFRSRAMAMIEEGDFRLLLDCSSLDYVSSAGLRVLFEILYKLRELSGWMGCHSVNSNVIKIFTMVDFVSEVPVFNSEEEALKTI